MFSIYTVQGTLCTLSHGLFTEILQWILIETEMRESNKDKGQSTLSGICSQGLFTSKSCAPATMCCNTTLGGVMEFSSLIKFMNSFQRLIWDSDIVFLSRNRKMNYIPLRSPSAVIFRLKFRSVEIQSKAFTGHIIIIFLIIKDLRAVA